MNRPALSLLAGVVALAAVTGFAEMKAPAASGAVYPKAAAVLPVERTSQPALPGAEHLRPRRHVVHVLHARHRGHGQQRQGRTPVRHRGVGRRHEQQEEARQARPGAQGPGTPATGDKSGADAPALLGTAEGKYAPGWTVQQTTEVAAGNGRGLQGVNCTAPDTEFWFPGASTATGRTDYVHLTNPDDSAAVVDIQLYGKDGDLKSTVGRASRSSRTPVSRSCCPRSPTTRRPT